MFDRTALPRVLPFGVYLAFIVLNDVLGRCGWTAPQLRWLYAVKIAAVLLVLLVCRRQYVELARPRLGWPAAALALVAGVLVLGLWVGLDAGWMQVGQSAGYDPRTGGVLDWRLAAVRIAGAALVVPVMEELFWRSFLLRWIDRADFLNRMPARASWKALLVTVVLFGFEHNLWLAGIVAGAVYSFLYMRSGNLWSAVLAHGVTNGLLGAWVIATANWTYW